MVWCLIKPVNVDQITARTSCNSHIRHIPPLSPRDSAHSLECEVLKSCAPGVDDTCNNVEWGAIALVIGACAPSLRKFWQALHAIRIAPVRRLSRCEILARASHKAAHVR